MSDVNGLTPDERVVMDHLIAAWNKFVNLDTTHFNEATEFMTAIHDAEHIMGMRVLRRDYPNGWSMYK